MMMCLFISSFLVILLSMLCMFISEYTILSREEMSSYECGFEHHSLSRVPLSLRYFLLTLLFLIFDLEIVYLLFFPFSLTNFWGFSTLISGLCFVFILYLGLLYEWIDGSLEWVM